MRRKAITARSASFAATALTLALIFSAPSTHAATLMPGSDPTADSIVLDNVNNSTSTLGLVSSGDFAGTRVNFSTPQPVNFTQGTTVGDTTSLTLDVPVGFTFTDLNFTSHFTGAGGANTDVTVTGSDGTSASFAPGNGNNPLTFSDTTPLTSLQITTLRTTPLSSFQISGLATSTPPPEIPVPGALPLFASGLGALGLLGWRRKRRAQAVA